MSLTPTPSPVPQVMRPPRRRGRGLRYAVSIVVAAALAVLIYGYQRFDTGPASGVGCSGQLPALSPGKTVFRIGTFNMHSGVGEDDGYDLSRTIAAVKDTDFCDLNEVRGRLFGKTANQAEELGQATAHAWLYLPSERRFWHDDFGNAVITRLPIGDWVRIPLPTQPSHGGLRNATILRVQFGGLLVPVLVTHIDRGRDQTNQLRMIRRLFDSLQQPAILLGDLNADSSNREIQAILAVPAIHDCIGEATGKKNDRIDWILARGFKTVTGAVFQNGASDHPMYWVDLQPVP